MAMQTRRGILASASAAVAGGLAPVHAAVRKDPGPGRGPWRHDSPQAHDLSPTALDRAAADLAARGERQGLVVIRHGRLVYERYWANAWARATPDWRNVSFSAAKSWCSTLTGLAISEGKLGLDDLVSRYHPVAVSGLHPDVRVRHLLTMTSGGSLQRKAHSLPPKRLDDRSPSGPPAEYKQATAAPAGAPAGYGMGLAPGKVFYYDGAAVDHLSDVVAGAAGRGTYRYMMDGIVGPLGCESFAYQPEGIDHNGNIRFGGSIQLSCRDMARLGQLYLNGGRWAGGRIVDEAYVRQAIAPSPLNPAYGFLWWLNGTGSTPDAPRSMYMAAGARGQFCFVLPEQDMVIATMGFGETELSAKDAWRALAPVLPRA
jgi:CubicO group peptidase (beta-lactamase class C family)